MRKFEPKFPFEGDSPKEKEQSAQRKRFAKILKKSFSLVSHLIVAFYCCSSSSFLATYLAYCSSVGSGDPFSSK